MKAHKITISFNKRGLFLKRIWYVDTNFALSKSKIIMLEESDVSC